MKRQKLLKLSLVHAAVADVVDKAAEAVAAGADEATKAAEVVAAGADVADKAAEVVADVAAKAAEVVAAGADFVHVDTQFLALKFQGAAMRKIVRDLNEKIRSTTKRTSTTVTQKVLIKR